MLDLGVRHHGFLDYLDSSAKRGRPAIIQDDRTWTYDDVVTGAREWSVRLGRHVDEGDVVCVDHVEDAFTYAVIFLGVMDAGGVHLTARDIAATWRRLDGLGRPWHAVTATARELPPGSVLRSEHNLAGPDSHSVDSSGARPPAGPAPLRGRILETSGSQGEAKWVYWTEADLLADRLAWVADTGLGPDDIVFNIHPLDFAHGVDVHLLAALGAGSRMIQWSGAFDAGRIRTELGRSRATYMSALPSHYEALADIDGPPVDLGQTLTTALTGGALLTSGAAEKVRSRCGVVLRRLYGATEAGIMCARLGTDAGPFLPPMRGVDLLVRPIPGIALERHRVGEPWFRRQHMASGYWGDPERTAVTFAGGWYASGDAVAVDEHDQVKVLGRSDDVWTDVDDRLHSVSEFVDAAVAVDGVAEAVVFAPAISSTGTVSVFCRLNADANRAAIVQARVEASLASLADRCTVVMLTSWPTSAVGKPDRRVLMTWARRQ